MAIKLIAFDMDDTLLKDDRTIGARTMAALRAAHEKGVKIVPATGRGRSTMWKYVEEIGCVDAAICTNGAQSSYNSLALSDFCRKGVVYNACTDNKADDNQCRENCVHHLKSVFLLLIIAIV